MEGTRAHGIADGPTPSGLAFAPRSGLADALATVFRTSLPAAGAAAAALVEEGGERVLAAWNCSQPDGLRALARADPAGLPAAGPALGPLVIDPFEAADGRLLAEAWVAAVRPAQRARAWLLVLREGAAPCPDCGTGAAAAEVAHVVGLLLEREIYAEEARRAREARDHFLVALHHELRTPATALLLEAELLRTGMLGSLPPRLQSTLARLDGRVGELIHVVQRVLDLAQLETAAGAGRPDLVEVREAIVALARHVEPAAESKGISLSLFFPRALPVIQTDGERFRRVLLYLLANAIKYGDNGHIQVRVEREPDGAGGRPSQRLVVRVVDSGRGIPPEEIERVFEPFTQVEEGARTDSRRRGLGLGLSIARKLARSIGGDVEVESAVGKGTTAVFTLPSVAP